MVNLQGTAHGSPGIGHGGKQKVAAIDEPAENRRPLKNLETAYPDSEILHHNRSSPPNSRGRLEENMPETKYSWNNTDEFGVFNIV